MKKILQVIVAVLLFTVQSKAQCTQTLLNWDNLDYYYNSGGSAPYQSYISNAQEQTQKFAIGKTYITFQTSAAGIADGENGTHTGDIAGFTGEDALFTPSSNGQTITMTFAADVSNVSFALYDIDYNARVDIDAYNSSNVKQTVTITRQGTTILTAVNGTNAYITANGTSLANSDNRGTATIDIASTINRIVITQTTLGSNAEFWLSDISACVTGSFPNNYQQTGYNQPLQGPYVNQPDYFLVTPDNNWVYMVDPATGNASRVFQDPAKTYVNSLAYDPYRRYMYYITENSSVNSSNRELKRYDFNTNTISTLIADISATLGIPTLGSGVESAGAAFYDDALYLGIEGGRSGSGSSTRTRETMIWRIDFDGSWNPTVAYQVFSTDAYQNSSNTSLHDFGDFLIRNGVLYDFNTARASSWNYTQSKYHHIDLITGVQTVYNNPSSAMFTGQAGMGWDGVMYYFKNGSGSIGQIGVYNEDGTNGSPTDITVIDGSGAWPGGNGDATENFRPAVDFGDAPNSYDPNIASPAAHDIIADLRLGANSDLEFVHRGQSAPASADNHDDGVIGLHTFDPLHGNYLVQASIYNNTGGNATVCAWLDHNGNGVFDAAEGITVNVPSSASVQTVYLYWPYISSPLVHGQTTYLRVRLARSSDQLSVNHPTGYFPSGEVEDYMVIVNSYALSTQAFDFDAKLTASKSVKLNWNMIDDSEISYYVIERSTSMNAGGWEMIHAEPARNIIGNVAYETMDQSTLRGVSYYRLKTVDKEGKIKLSQVKRIENRIIEPGMNITPNPARSRINVHVQSDSEQENITSLQIFSTSGALVHTQKIRVHAGNNHIPVELDARVSSGQYVIRIQLEGKVLTSRLIINR